MHKWLKIGLITLGVIVFLIIGTRIGFYLKKGDIMAFPTFIVCKWQGAGFGFAQDWKLFEVQCSESITGKMIDSPFLLRMGNALNYRAY